MKQVNVGILGATGAVGQEMIKILEERNFPVASLRPIASARSAGSKIMFRGQECTIVEASDDAFEGLDIVLGAAENDIAERFAPSIVKAGAVFLDNSSAFRMDEDVPLVVPEVNPGDVAWHNGVIANPNCSTIQMLVVLKPLHDAFGTDVSDAAIRRAVAEHNRVCALIRALGDFRKEVRPRITGYEFHVLTLATYVAPKYLLIDKLEETLEEVRSREPEERAYRARIALVGSEVDDSEFIRLIEDTGAYVCADRFCFGSLPGRDPITLTDEDDALTQICRQYVYRGQCPRTMNMEKVYGRKQYVADIAREYHADGILYEQIKFCDPWAYERTLGSVMLREDYGFPVLSVDRPYNIRSSIGQMRTRVQAFVESIEIKKIQGGVR